MGSGFNMPDGCYESDIPGYNDIEIAVEFTCDLETCGVSWDEDDCVIDPNFDNDLEAVCPECGTNVKMTYKPDYD